MRLDDFHMRLPGKDFQVSPRVGSALEILPGGGVQWYVRAACHAADIVVGIPHMMDDVHRDAEALQRVEERGATRE
jgi:hypothetical protein